MKSNIIDLKILTFYIFIHSFVDLFYNIPAVENLPAQCRFGHVKLLAECKLTAQFTAAVTTVQNMRAAGRWTLKVSNLLFRPTTKV